MMNCYEKQIENISKLLCKLSASISPNDNIVDLDYEKPDKLSPMENTADDDVAQVNSNDIYIKTLSTQKIIRCSLCNI